MVRFEFYLIVEAVTGSPFKVESGMEVLTTAATQKMYKGEKEINTMFILRKEHSRQIQ